MQAFFIFEFVDRVPVSCNRGCTSFSSFSLLLFPALVLRIRRGRLLFRIFSWCDHIWVIRRLKLTIREQVHLLPHRGFDRLELGLLDELSERVDLLLIEKRDEVIAEPAHLRVPVLQELLHEALLSNFLHVIRFLKTLELACCLGEGAFASLFLEDQDDECAFLIAFVLLAAPMEKHGDLVDLEHDVGEEELVAILWLLVRLITVLMLIGLVLGFPAPLV